MSSSPSGVRAVLACRRQGGIWSPLVPKVVVPQRRSCRTGMPTARRHLVALERRRGREPDRLGRAAVVQEACRAAALEVLVRLGEPGVGAAGTVARGEQGGDGEQVP